MLSDYGTKRIETDTNTHLTYVEEVATTSTLKSGRSAPHERLRLTAEPLRLLGEPEDSDLRPTERRSPA